MKKKDQLKFTVKLLGNPDNPWKCEKKDSTSHVWKTYVECSIKNFQAYRLNNLQDMCADNMAEMAQALRASMHAA